MKYEVQQCHPLNLSDHLALSVKLDCNSQLVAPQQSNRKLNWRKAFSDGSKHTQLPEWRNIEPVSTLEHPIQSISELDEEIASVISFLHEAATATIPVIKHKEKIKSFIHAKQHGEIGEMLADLAQTSPIWRWSLQSKKM